MAEQNISIVGGESLLGRDLRDQLADRRLSGRLQLIGSDEDAAGILSEQEGEAVVLAALDSDRLQRSDVVFFAGSARSSIRAYDLLAQSNARPVLVDLTHGLEEYPNARLRSPMLEPNGFQPPEGTIHVIAHPAASILASLLTRLHRRHAIRHAVAQIFEPASERGQVGLTELQQQTASLLTFKGLSKEIFDAQLSFNMLPRYGNEAPQHLEDVEQRIDRHLATLLNLDGLVPMPSIRLAQAPVFHGYSVSLWIEFESYPGAAAVAEALATAQIEVRAPDLEPPSNVQAVGQGGITAGLIEADRNHPRAVWMWAVADNFRIAADDAIQVAQCVL